MPDLDVEMERALAPLLERPLADPESLPDLEWRAARVRRRRWGRRLGAAAGVAAVAVLVVAALPDAADQEVRTTPAADAAAPRPQPPSPILPFQPSLRDPSTIHRGAIDGEEWELHTGFQNEGRPCVELQEGQGTRSLCGNDFHPWRPFEDGSATVAGTELRFGAAAPSVAGIRLVLEDGTFVDATMIEPDGFPVKAWFAPVPKGERVRTITPLGADGLPAGG